MYAACYELDFGTCHVVAGQVKPGTPGLLPPRLLAALAQQQLQRLAVRSRFEAGGQRVTVLVPWEGSLQSAALQSLLAETDDVDWCLDADSHDSVCGGLPPLRHWLDGSDFQVQGMPCAVDASWLPDWAPWARGGAPAPLLHQINIAHRPADADEHRALRKHLARLDLLADEAAWPEARLQAQRDLVQRRLNSPWLVDEVLATATDAQCRQALLPLQGRLRAQGGAALADAVVQPGDFNELLHTGLDSGRFISASPVAVAGRSIDAELLWAALGLLRQRDQAHTVDAFISHASVDSPRAQQLCAGLEAGGLRCWIAPRDIAAGLHYAEVIDDAIRASRAIVLLLTDAALESTHVLRELERAVHHRALVLPLRLAEVQPRKAFSYLLSGCQWTEALPGVEDRAVLDRLRAAIARAA